MIKQEKGITLISLVTTIIVLLILAGISLSLILGDNGILHKSKKALFLYRMKTYQEKVDTLVIKRSQGKNTDLPKISVGLEDQPGIETVITNISEDFKDNIIIQDNIMYYKYTGNQEEIEWCFDGGYHVWEYDSYEEFAEDINKAPISKGEYSEVNGIYVCAPDLTGFNTYNTYYVLYDENYNEIIGNNLRKGAPEDITEWYDYSTTSKKWANIVTIGGDGNPANLDNDRVYLTWIPRYVYKVDKTNRNVKIKFVDKDNNYKDFDDPTQNATYPDLEPTYDENGNQTNYCLPESFIWDSTNISGFWVSKYQVSAIYANDVKINDLEFSMTDTSISIVNMSMTNPGSVTVASYDIFVNGELKGSQNTISSSKPFKIEGLSPNTEYTIKLHAKSADGVVLGIYTYPTKIKTTEKTIVELTKPNLNGYDKNQTYYVTYDSSGNETIGSKIEYDSHGVPTNIPSGWYDYENKIWANIVTIGGDGDYTNLDNDRAYFTWIPRYEYKVNNTWKNIEIRFISTSQTEANTALGYSLPESFTWDSTPISGYWVSKYQLSATYANDLTINDLEFSMTDTSISIVNMSMTNPGSIAPATYEVFVDGELKGSQNTISSSKPFKIEGLSPNTEYSIKIHVKASNGAMLCIYDYPYKIKTTERPVSELTRPNLNGYNKENTYYVTYDSNGNESIGPKIEYDSHGVPTNIPDGWYNYENKMWANIVTIGGDGDYTDLDNDRAYFTWIPRYEYKVNNTWKNIEIRFISVTQTVANSGLGYKIPESFTWGNTPISGYWVSKYQLSASYAHDVTINDLEFTMTDTSISIVNMSITNPGSVAVASYDVFVDGELKGSQNTISSSKPFKIEGLSPNTEYTIKLHAKASNGIVLGIYTYPYKVKTTESPISELTKPNLKGYDKDNTYYVTYDSSGNESIGSKIDYDSNGVPTNMPSGWYNYENKIWANIVTISGDGDYTKSDNDRAYFTWIPRYEFKVNNTWKNIEIRFISTSQTEANTALGYKLPESFKWGNTPISGYWVSKYQVSAKYANDITINDLEFSMTDTSISIVNLSVTNPGSISISSYEVFADGVSKGSQNTISNSKPFKIEGLSANTEYTITIHAKASDGNVLGIYTYPTKVKTTENSIAELTKPNLKGYDKDHTYYVTYDSSGNESIGSKVNYDANGVPTNMPSGWYNYENKIWANIVTIGGNGNPSVTTNSRSYFTWIPRYEYKVNNTWKNIEIRFISTSQTEANTALGYKLPESFKWGNTPISGYWVSKYQVSSIDT